MKLLASLIIAVSLALGAIAATTAYSPRLGAIDPEVELLTLNAPAGQQPDQPRQPLFRPGTKLTNETLDALRTANVERVRVKEFAFTRWDKAWLFALAVLGLTAGAVMMRIANRQALEAAMAPGGEIVHSPETLLRGAREELAALQEDARALPNDRERLKTILPRLGRLQLDRLDAFVSTRPVLIARLGMGGYAQLMDRFAAAERQINRAWSAAADGVLEESLICIDAALPLLDEAIQRL